MLEQRKVPYEIAARLLDRNGPIGEITTRTRREAPQGYKFPPLLEDARENHYLTVTGENMVAYLKPVAGPYTVDGLHLLVIPDSLPDRTGMRAPLPDMRSLSEVDLGILIKMGRNTAEEMLALLPNVDHVDLGLHYAPKDTYVSEEPTIDKSKLKQRINVFPDTMHLHVIGYDKDEIKEKKWEDVVNTKDLLGRTGDAIHTITEEIFNHEVVEGVFAHDSEFNEVFTKTQDARGRLRFKMNSGLDGFDYSALPRILQIIDQNARDSYEGLSKCFFAYDNEENKFVEDPNDHGRYQLLPLKERTEKVTQYIADRSDWLSSASQTGLRILAERAQTAQAILDREATSNNAVTRDHRSDTAEKVVANRFWAHKGLAYAMVWSAQRGEDGATEWLFGFDVPVFTVEGIPQSSPIMDKIITKEEGAMPTEKLRGIQAREASVVNVLLTKYPNYQQGTTTPDKV